MATLIRQFITHVAQIFAAGSGGDLVASIPLEKGHAFWTPLKQALFSITGPGPVNSNILPQLSLPSSEAKETFVTFLLAVLRHIKGPDETRDERDRAFEEFNLLIQVTTEVNRLYGSASPEGSQKYAFFNPLVLRLARALVQVSDRAASLSSYPPRSSRSPRSIRDTTRQTIERSMQIAASSMSDAEWSDNVGKEHVVGDNIWTLANILWRIYAERKLHTQATELQKTLSTLTPHEEKRLSSRGRSIWQTDVCQSYYWRGRLGVVLLDMRGANYWLDKAWRTCPEEAWQQRRAILTRFIPVNLLLGRLPSLSLLKTFNLERFIPLVQAFQTGDVPAWRRELDENCEWYRRRSVWLLLFERGEILVWRNLLRQSLRMFYATNPSAPKNRCPTWVFLTTATKAFEGSDEAEDSALALEDIVCIIASLIDQSLILGHLSYSSQQLVMKPSLDGLGGFPKVSQVVPRRVDAIA